MRSIIVEGMDGSGKDTLIRDLSAVYPAYMLHERASTSLGGPVADLSSWVARDAVRMEETGPWIYNRHPLISEPIYAPIRRVNPGLSGVWTNQGWLDAYRRIVASVSVVVVCQPPWETVRATLMAQGPDAHMPGVADNAPTLYEAYGMLLWPGRLVRYDYTRDSIIHLIDTLNQLGS